MLVKIFMKIFQKFFKDNQKLNANEVSVVDNNKAKTLDNVLGNLSNLNTNNKTNLVNAINEVNDKGVKLLFNGNITTNGTDIKLSENINNFDLICVVTRNDTGEQSLFRLNTTIIPLALYKAGGTNYHIPVSKEWAVIFNIKNSTTLNTQDGFSEYTAIQQVYGIKL